MWRWNWSLPWGAEVSSSSCFQGSTSVNRTKSISAYGVTKPYVLYKKHLTTPTSYMNACVSTICCCSITKSCPILHNPMDYKCARLPCPSSSPWVCQSSCPLHQWCHPVISFSVALFSFNLPQHQGLFQLISSLHQVVKVLELQLQHESFQWVFKVISFRID